MTAAVWPQNEDEDHGISSVWQSQCAGLAYAGASRPSGAHARGCGSTRVPPTIPTDDDIDVIVDDGDEVADDGNDFFSDSADDGAPLASEEELAAAGGAALAPVATARPFPPP
ncbi:MAG: hypothetical protein U1U88_000834 [Lawsonella clevelandensis]